MLKVSAVLPTKAGSCRLAVDAKGVASTLVTMLNSMTITINNIS